MLQAVIKNPKDLGNMTLRIGCPYCGIASTLTLVTVPIIERLDNRQLPRLVLGYACDSCDSPIPIRWLTGKEPNGNRFYQIPEEVVVAREPFEFAHVPPAVKAPIEETLDCLSVSAYNGFAAMCRRVIQAACDALGADGSTKVEAQIKELKEMGALDGETFPAVYQIMLGGHDGAHPQLPPVDQDRARLLLQLLRDVIHELFTRPGRIKEAAKKRAEAIKQQSPA